MTHTPAQRPTSDRPLLLAFLAGGVLLLATPLASAQLPALPVAPPQVPIGPIATPAGSIGGDAGTAGANAQADLAASTAIVPVPLPLPAAGANAAIDLHAGLDGASASVDGTAAPLPPVHADAHVGVLAAIVQWLGSLF